MGRAHSGRSAHRSTAQGAAADRVELTARYLRRRYVVNGLTAAQIAAETGLTVHLFPKMQEFFIGFRVEA